ncbi:UDP-N-acetylmuramoyl-L-alanyl-D-glutamate--2,6-diaminopimelate ligase [Novacetimonas cocois]|uniref:UDP-N-acetylmuramoyl-L-alanyl-D-glutamate--2,6-diaminopimelate ligase n=1 Tax=Novacetimonas cocois TaxID=1747507 RepID=A0A365YR42_9PROT|nr:UDP-N-acetylmuramoyl-L-alanyl-D-glutamate--2,6-diaminopimelate ligase [Novacetimonas cocois]RBM05231.1 UDP-N-acetylmuramoyl-L-alanyl-D-glutamate--2,6-diaminopimelate ligase [Novacetimonas cocois]
MKLTTVLRRAGLVADTGGHDPDVTGISADSRQIGPGMIFAALPGSRADGRAYIAQALHQGACGLVSTSDACAQYEGHGVACIATHDPRHTLAVMAAALMPAMPGHVVAVTGTNGKTSTVEFLRQIWRHEARMAASIGTLGIVSPDAPVAAGPSLTTPDSVTLAKTLCTLGEHGVTDVAMEASSHGLEQRRLDGVPITAAGFSNLTRDHLDYHGSTGAYRTAKLRLFDTLLPDGGLAAANADMDPATLDALRAIAARRGLRLRLVGERGDAIRLLRAIPRPEGQVLTLEHGGATREVSIPLPGRFQVDNLLLAAALSGPHDADVNAALDCLPFLTGVRGRMEHAATLPNGAAIYVDYAHTPDALERLLLSLRPHATGRLVAVFGAGGDRDRGKRPLMGDVAARLADDVIVTDDNPRSEEAASIRQQIMAAAPTASNIGGRRQAIAEGLSRLKAGDVMVVAGKGHEQGQIIGTTVLPFDDVSIIRELTGNS